MADGERIEAREASALPNPNDQILTGMQAFADAYPQHPQYAEQLARAAERIQSEYPGRLAESLRARAIAQTREDTTQESTEFDLDIRRRLQASYQQYGINYESTDLITPGIDWLISVERAEDLTTFLRSIGVAEEDSQGDFGGRRQLIPSDVDYGFNTAVTQRLPVGTEGVFATVYERSSGRYDVYLAYSEQAAGQVVAAYRSTQSQESSQEE